MQDSEVSLNQFSETTPKVKQQPEYKQKRVQVRVSNKKGYVAPEPIGAKMQFLRQRFPNASRKELRKLLKNVKVTRVKKD